MFEMAGSAHTSTTDNFQFLYDFFLQLISIIILLFFVSSWFLSLETYIRHMKKSEADSASRDVILASKLGRGGKEIPLGLTAKALHPSIEGWCVSCWASEPESPLYGLKIIQNRIIFRESFFIIHLLTCVYIVWVISPPCSPPLQSFPLPLTSRQNLFCPYF
jgi:hypothetical protein